MKIARVVCGVIFKGDKVFIARRKQGKVLAGYWEFPGGKVEKGEDDINALERELWEEFKMTVEIQDFIASNLHDYERGTIELIAYQCIYKESQDVLTDHDRIDWVEIGNLTSFKLAPADLPILQFLNNQKLIS